MASPRARVSDARRPVRAVIAPLSDEQSSSRRDRRTRLGAIYPTSSVRSSPRAWKLRGYSPGDDHGVVERRQNDVVAACLRRRSGSARHHRGDRTAPKDRAGSMGGLSPASRRRGCDRSRPRGARAGREGDGRDIGFPLRAGVRVGGSSAPSRKAPQLWRARRGRCGQDQGGAGCAHLVVSEKVAPTSAPSSSSSFPNSTPPTGGAGTAERLSDQHEQGAHTAKKKRPRNGVPEALLICGKEENRTSANRSQES